MFRFDDAAFLRLVRGETTGLPAASARLGLSLASFGYRLVVNARNKAYSSGWKTIHHAEVPVISVGNLTLGGTGKTPMVEWVARWFRLRDVRVAILSRGYGQTEGINDEGRVLEENLPDVPHLQGRDRAALARIAVEELESQVVVLDDGFQHRRLARDLDMVLLDAFDPFGLGRIFPRGLLRESSRSLRRASLVVLSRADVITPEGRARIRYEAERRAGQPLEWAEARHAPRDFVDTNGVSSPLDKLATKKIAAFCGIGNPKAFETTLNTLGASLIAFRSFPDHHPYSAADVSDLAAWADRSGADLVLTTQKDLVKLRTASLGRVPLLALRIGLEFLSGESSVAQALERHSISNPRDSAVSQPDHEPIDLNQLRFEPLAERPSKVALTDLGRPLGPNPPMADWLDALPEILAGKSLRRLRDAILKAHSDRAPIVAALGGHVVKTGCTPYLIDWIDRGIISGLALNGSAAIHDSELAIIGKTSEDVGPRLIAGTFGFAQETSDVFVAACDLAARTGRGLGSALGEVVQTHGGPGLDASLLVAAHRKKIPLTVHVAVGTDIVHMTSRLDGGALGKATLEDFRILCNVVAGMANGVWLNLGSAVVLPEVFLKTVSIARNLGRSLDGLTTANLDFHQQYRGLLNVLQRPGAEGVALTGHHEIMIPLLHAAVISRLPA